jgi:hypothetical protein
MNWLARGAERYISEIYSAMHSLEEAPPARGKNAGTPKKQKVCLNPEVIWDLMQQARDSNSSLRKVLQVRRQDAHVGVASSVGELWSNKLAAMYSQLRSFSFDPRAVNHYCIAFDPSRHSTREVGVGVAYSWERDIAAYCDHQVVLPCRFILDDEMDMLDYIKVCVVCCCTCRVVLEQLVPAQTHFSQS